MNLRTRLFPRLKDVPTDYFIYYNKIDGIYKYGKVYRRGKHIDWEYNNRICYSKRSAIHYCIAEHEVANKHRNGEDWLLIHPPTTGKTK
jgi:hypothetical protein